MTDIPDQIVIDCKMTEQKTLEYCWLSVASTVNDLINAGGKSHTEGGLANMILGRTDCTQTPIPQSCVVPGTNQMMGRLYEMLGIGCMLEEPLWFATSLEELLAQRVFQIAYRRPDGGGHTCLVNGYRKVAPELTQIVNAETIQLSLLDPFYGRGEPLWLTYPEICDRPGVGVWAETIIRFHRIEKQSW